MDILEWDDSQTDFETAILKFQERYNLVAEGQLTDVILWGIIFPLRTKWNRRHLT